MNLVVLESFQPIVSIEVDPQTNFYSDNQASAMLFFGIECNSLAHNPYILGGRAVVTVGAIRVTFWDASCQLGDSRLQSPVHNQRNHRQCR
jgi:hypothetical protein